MRRRALDQEIGSRLAGARELRPNAGVGWLHRAVGQAGPVLANSCIKALGAARVDVVVDRIDPFNVGPEAHLAAKIERHVDAGPRFVPHRIDKARKRNVLARWQIPVSRGTLAHWIIRPSELYYTRLYEALLKTLFSQSLIHGDETISTPL